MLALFSLSMSPFFANDAMAASVTQASDTLSREKASTASDHTILFVTPTGVASGNTVTLTFSGGSGIGSLVGADFDFAEGSTGTCSSASFTEKGVVTSSPSSSQFSIAGASSTVTITSGGASATITPGRCVRLKIGLNATDTTGSGPGTHQITNPSTGTLTITIAGTFGDSGTISIPIIDDDQVTITATVNQSITFDLDTYATSTTSTETATPYSVALGTLTTGAVTGSNESSINGIWFDLATNASGGAIVTIVSANGALKSTATPTDTIPSATAAMAAGTANYGVCANRNATTSGTLTKVAPFASTCGTTPASNTVGAVTTTAQTIYNTSGAPVAGGRGEIMVDAAISGATPAHADYTDTLTLIATATF